jgi:DNA-binding SARP family transcriptional activator
VVRDRSLYGLRPGADLWLDAEAFEELVAEGDRLFDQNPAQGICHYQKAIALYQGDYLEDCLYEEWASEERERLLTLYLRTADRLARTLVDQGAWEEAIDVCRSILARDDCWEQAYRLIMVSYVRLGNRAQALRAYQRCTECLQEELAIEPSQMTVELYESLLTTPERPAND